MNMVRGQTAPDFTLPSSTGGSCTLRALQDKKVVLAFYVLDFTGT